MRSLISPGSVQVRVCPWLSPGPQVYNYSFDIRTQMYDIGRMNGNELLKKLKKFAKERKINLELVKSHGKGSHATLPFGGRKDDHERPEKRDRPRPA